MANRQNDGRPRSGARLVRPAKQQQGQWWFAQLTTDLVAGGSATARIYKSSNPPDDDPVLTYETKTVYAFFQTGVQKLLAGADVRIEYHRQYRRWYVVNARCA